ncbi:hypothetical protein, partial [Actinobacillus pleuropneumoniae]
VRGHYSSLAGNVTRMAHMDNFRKNMYLGELVFGKIGFPMTNVIRMVQISIPTQAMKFEQDVICTGISDLKIHVHQGKVV